MYRQMLRKFLTGLATAGLTAGLLSFAAVGSVTAGSGAVSTTDNAGWTDTYDSYTNVACFNGHGVDCNIYADKRDVWFSGLPISAALGAGDYYFAVLSPGGQPDPNDCSSNVSNGYEANLSDACQTNNTGAGDDWTNRVFAIDDTGNLSYSGTHDFDSVNNEIQLFPYDDTPNNGGVYILAVCQLPDTTTSPPGGPGVDAHDCKYDAFKVSPEGGECPECVLGNPLTIGKTADGDYTDTYTWDIAKSVDKTTVEQLGGSVSFTYTVQVTHDAGAVSDVSVSGTITVTNPNLFSVTGVDVTDQLSDGTVCTVTDGLDQSLDSGDSKFDYSCDLGDTLPTSDITNSVSATWPAQTFMDAGEADFTTPDAIVFTATNVDNCTTATDPLPAGGTSLDNPFPTTVCVGDTGDGGAGTATGDGFTFTYHVSYIVPAHGCVDKTNTATESTDGNTSSVTVTICGPAATGALTMGFWKTTNGQGLIGTYCIKGTYNLGTYLKGLGAGSGPFSNAPATCSALKTYVSGILSGANAKNMNTMVKAQMLATSLDVWFSGTGWTSTTVNKVKPPSVFLSHNNLGTFNMDTTSVCPMVDNLSTGTATCKNNTPSTNAVTAGAVPSSPMSIQAILDYASTTPIPFNGSTSNPVWFGGNQTKEEILKNIFDQFNNGDAFGSF